MLRLGWFAIIILSALAWFCVIAVETLPDFLSSRPQHGVSGHTELAWILRALSLAAIACLLAGVMALFPTARRRALAWAVAPSILVLMLAVAIVTWVGYLCYQSPHGC
jgi:uncharacterized membrane protein